MSKVARKCLRTVPKEFICPISKKFMTDPVISSSTKRTYDRKSVVSLRNKPIKTNDEIDILPPENDLLLPDHDLRRRITAWRREYSLAPPFFFISKPTDLEAAVNALLDRQEHQLEDRRLLQFLRELQFAIQGNMTVVNSRECFLLVSRLIAECPLDSTSEWVELSVGILAMAHNFKSELDLGAYQHQMLAVLDRVCGDIDDPAFQRGLVNLIHSIMASKEHIINNNRIVRTLSSYILSSSHDLFGGPSKQQFDKLFFIILGLWSAEGGLKYPRLSQAVASLVWPMHEMMDESQYHDLFLTISSRLKTQLEVQKLPSSLPIPLEAMTRAGLVRRIFHVLDYISLPEAVKRENMEGWLGRGKLTSPEAEEVVVMRCFEILEYLSRSSIGRLEIVRVIKRGGFQLLASFYYVLSLYTLPRQKESHVLPALSMIFNVMKYTRYTSLMPMVHAPGYQEFFDLGDDDHPRVSKLANRIFSCCAKIGIEESDPPEQDY